MIESADLDWRGGQPFARDFGDIYHAADEAREVERVFIRPAKLEEKAARAAAAGSTLRIGELGFGTGLNYAVAAALALRAGCRLHFISFDIRPIDPQQFIEIARQRKPRLPAYAGLERGYPPLLAGWHRRVLAEGRIWLSLYWGEAGAGLSEMIGRQTRPIDAWFLDGFAPDRNPEMWREELLQKVAGLSADGTAVASFTAVGRVRRCLESCGFAMQRVDQRPHKRESLAGTYAGTYAGQRLPGQTQPRRVAVAGAGIAGASVARHLAELGVAVSVFDPAAAVAAGATGIPAMLLHPRLLGDESGRAAWRAHAYAYSQARARHFPGFIECGVLQTLGPNLDPGKMRRILRVYSGSGMVKGLDAAEASEMSGWAFDAAALYFPGAGMVEPARFTRALLDHPRIDVRLQQRAPPDIRPLVLACAGATRAYAPASFLETAEVQGQVDLVAVDRRPRLAVVGDRYLAPTESGVVVGATFEHRPWPEAEATDHNLASIRGRDCRWIARARATRTMASDRTPIIGELAPDLYVSTAHGAMGMVSAPFAGAIIASRISGDFAPLDRGIEALVAPHRFRERQARRGYRFGATE